MKRKLILALVVVLSFAGGAVSYGAVKAVNGTYDGFPIVKVFSGGKELAPTGVPAIIHKGTTLVPIALLRQLGVDVKWNAETQSVDVTMPPPKVVPVLTTQELEELAKAVYLVRTFSSDGKPVSQASGFIVDGIFVTNAHVGADKAYIEAQIDGKWQRLDDVAFVERDVDLMGYKGVKGGLYLPVSTELPIVGEPVYAIGFPKGQLAITIGKVTRVAMAGGIYYIDHNAKVDGGSSGGVLLNGSGKVVGVNNSGVFFKNEYLSTAIPSMYLEQHIGAT